MSDAFFDKFIADLVKGAEVNSRSVGGPGVNIVIDRENHGREEKVANQGGVGALIGGLGPGLGAMGGLGPLGGQAGAAIGAGLGADPGQGLDAAIDAGVGHALGGMAGRGLGALLHLSPGGVDIAKTIGATGGSMLGGHLGGKDDRSAFDRLRGKQSALEQRFADGAAAATRAFGLKEAFLGALAPIAGSILGGAGLRAGAGALARGAGGKMLGGLAAKALPHMTGGIGGAATDMIGSMAGGALGQHMMPQPRQPQPQQPMM